MRDAFGGQQGFVNGLGNFSIVKQNLHGIADGITPPGLSTIFLDVSMFDKDESGILFGIIHEIGHIFDFKSSGVNSRLYKSQSFVDRYAPGCYTSVFGCVPNDKTKTNYPIIPVNGNPGWNPNLAETSWYGLNASIDDFADSFANHVMISGGRDVPPDRLVSIERRTIIAVLIDMSK